MQSAVGHIELEPSPQSEDALDCRRCERLADCTLNPAKGHAKQGRAQNLKLALALKLMRC